MSGGVALFPRHSDIEDASSKVAPIKSNVDDFKLRRARQAFCKKMYVHQQTRCCEELEAKIKELETLAHYSTTCGVPKSHKRYSASRGSPGGGGIRGDQAQEVYNATCSKVNRVTPGSGRIEEPRNSFQCKIDVPLPRWNARLTTLSPFSAQNHFTTIQNALRRKREAGGLRKLSGSHPAFSRR